MEIPTELYIKVGVLALVALRAAIQKSLTPAAIVVAVVTGLVHAVHPWSIFFILLVAFFVTGTAVTKVKHAHKATLTTSATGNVPDAPHPRSAYQVLCNSLPATIAIGIHALHMQIKLDLAPGFLIASGFDTCLPHPQPTATSYGPPSIASALPYGILAYYAAVTADTFASELGILSSGEPWLVTTLPFILGFKAPRRVPRGTNGGVSLAGLIASAVGAAIVAALGVALIPYCKTTAREMTELRTAYIHNYQALGTKDRHLRLWTFEQTMSLAILVTLAGFGGALLDSVLGAVCQATVIDAQTGKIVEGDGGSKVQFAEGKASRRVIVGRDRLSNNAVNFWMGAITMVVVWGGVAVYMGMDVNSFIREWITLGETVVRIYRIYFVGDLGERLKSEL